MGRRGVRGQDLGVELGQELLRPPARMPFGPYLGTFEQGRDRVQIPLGDLGQERIRTARHAQGRGAPLLGAAGGLPDLP